MEWLELVLGIVLIVLAAFLVVAVLFQSGKEKGLSGSIVGGADTFGGKSKKAKKDALLNTLTTILSIVFAVLAVVLYIYIASQGHADVDLHAGHNH